VIPLSSSSAAIPVAAIRRLTIHDGPGVRDTVFVKGCPLRCAWCHNPECISSAPRLLFHENLCTGCRRCLKSCPNGVHFFDREGRHLLRRERCRNCGKCADDCLFNALEICGTPLSAEELLAKLLRDRDFFAPAGGVTLSGGEPALYPDFTAELFRRLKETGIHTALDSCGAVGFEAYRKILPHTDLVLFDLKGMDPERHRRNTGHDNRVIHENLRKIAAFGTPVEIRMPIVPGCNDFPDDIEGAGKLLAEIGTTVRVRLLAYHSLAREKYAAAGLTDTMPAADPPDDARLADIAETLSAFLPKEIPVSFG